MSKASEVSLKKYPKNSQNLDKYIVDVRYSESLCGTDWNPVRAAMDPFAGRIGPLRGPQWTPWRGAMEPFAGRNGPLCGPQWNPSRAAMDPFAGRNGPLAGRNGLLSGPDLTRGPEVAEPLITTQL